MGCTQTLSLGLQRCTDFCSLWGAPALAGPLCCCGPWSQPALLLSVSLSPLLNACPPNAASWSTVEQSLVKLGENLNNLSNSPLRSQADDCVSLIKR